MFNIFKKKSLKRKYKIADMHCVSCATMIESELEDIGINASCSYIKQVLEIEVTENIDEEKIKKAVSKAGYRIIS